MVVGGVAVIAMVVIAGLTSIAFLPARPLTTLGFGGLLVAAGAVFTFATGPGDDLPSILGLALVVAGVVVGAVGVARESRSGWSDGA